MNRDELLKFHASVCEDARNLMKLKNRDYAGNGGTEPFANFTRCEAMGVCQTEAGILVRVIDKISRMSSFLESGKMHVEDESFYDAMIDVVNYMVLLGAYVQDKDKSANAETLPGSLVKNWSYGEEDLTPKEVVSTMDTHLSSTVSMYDEETKDLPRETIFHHQV
tara:strand:+ start:804 stop:1298 length:495 start_codon:yes stop_codon:yes gene_type:complete